MRMIRKCLVRVAACLVVLIGTVVLFEAGLKVAAVGWKHMYRVTHRRDNHFYIYVIGGSTSYGEPYQPKITFPKIISYMFGGKIHGKEIVIINLAEPGRDIQYGFLALYKEWFARPRRDAVLLVYAGINDPVTKADDPTFGRWRLMQKSLSLTKLQSVLEGMVSGSLFEGTQPGSGLLYRIFGLNNSLQKYAHRLRGVITLAKSYEIPTVLSTLVSNIAQFDPEDSTIYESPETLALFVSAKDLEQSGKYAEALEVLQSIAAKPLPSPAHVYYHMGKCYQGLGRYDQAREYYWKAMDVGDQRRTNRWQNEVIRRLASEYGVDLLDAAALFEAHARHGLPGYDLFMDAHHPNLEGYILLAQGFARELEKMLNEKIVHPVVTPEMLETQFDFGEEDLYSVYTSQVGWLIGHATLVRDREERLKAAEDFLRKAEEIHRETPDIYFFHFFIEVLKEDREEAMRWLEKGDLLGKNKSVFWDNRWMFKVLNLSETVLPEHVVNALAPIEEEAKNMSLR